MFIVANTRQPATTSEVLELVEYFEWYFSKYYQVHKRRIFPKEPVTYVLHDYHNSLDYTSSLQQVLYTT